MEMDLAKFYGIYFLTPSKIKIYEKTTYYGHLFMYTYGFANGTKMS